MRGKSHKLPSIAYLFYPKVCLRGCDFVAQTIKLFRINLQVKNYSTKADGSSRTPNSQTRAVRSHQVEHKSLLQQWVKYHRKSMTSVQQQTFYGCN